jgi:hypothetical protein
VTFINSNTGKGWTDEEEHAFAEIMGASRLNRLPAIRLYRRFKGDLRRALKHACGSGNPALQASRQNALVKARGARRLKGVFYRENPSQRGLSTSLAPHAHQEDGAAIRDCHSPSGRCGLRNDAMR